MVRTLAAVALVLLWAGFFVIYTLVHLVVVDLPMRYTSVLQDTPRSYLWIGGGAVLWGCLGLLLPGARSLFSAHSWQPAAGLIAFAVLNGGLAGGVGLGLVNSFGDSSPGEPARFEVTGVGHTSVDIRLIEPYPGTTFTMPSGMMSRVNRDRDKRFVVHRGRLRLLWGEFR
jgi:hypothetical protein